MNIYEYRKKKLRAVEEMPDLKLLNDYLSSINSYQKFGEISLDDFLDREPKRTEMLLYIMHADRILVSNFIALMKELEDRDVKTLLVVAEDRGLHVDAIIGRIMPDLIFRFMDSFPNRIKVGLISSEKEIIGIDNDDAEED